MNGGAFDMSGIPHDVVLRGVFIHPDHLSAGFCADESAYSSSSETASTVSYDDDCLIGELSEAALEGLALGGDAIGSSAQDATQDYFAPRSSRYSAHASTDAYPMDSSSTMSSAWCPSPSSTAATTPTISSPSPPLHKSTALARRPSQMSNSGIDSPSLPATFSFAAFGTPALQPAPARSPLPRAPSPTRSHPYVRGNSSGTAMQRSVSTPVETQRQVEDRQRRLSAAEDAMDTRAVKMARSKSGACTPAEPCFSTASAPMTRRSSGMLVSPLSEVFGPDWGKTLPPAPVDASKPLAFPYNVARPPLSPLRNARSRSFAGLEHAYDPMALDAPADSASSASMSSSSTRTLRPRSRLSISLGPLTPIMPEATTAAQSTEPEHSSSANPIRTRLQRGMSF
ncbi:hypothetical protein JCM10908_001684 [Rhodotorula pacifica]|uniref:uncharacterized protein n=1 Tax=Rhodotorula pacifica TaxID=1495444 RepID=UPI003179861E